MSRILTEQGYITGFTVEPTAAGEVDQGRPQVHGGAPARDLRPAPRLAPGRRHYVNSGEIPRVQGGMGTAIVSTSSGVMTGHEAKQKGVGGEVVAFVW